jgi:glycosyltransferase involved in cell wall biosynthesis
MPEESRDKSKVLYTSFLEIPSPTGLACWVEEEIRELARHYEVDALSLKSEDLSHIERLHGSRLLRVPVGNGPFLSKVKAFQRALNRQLDSEDYRLCHFTSIWEGMVLASRKKSVGFKLVYEVHGLASVEFRTEHPTEIKVVEQSYPLKQQEERCFKAADRILTGSQLIADHLKKRGVPEKKLKVLRPAVDLTFFEDAASEPSPSGTVLYLGSLLPWQGIHSLLAAMAELPRQFPARLLLVAPKREPFLREVKGKVQIMGLARKVEILDPVPLEKLASLLARATVCVAPLSGHERNNLAAVIPHKLLVYMAASKPVVASRLPVINELIEDGVHALLFSPADSRSLAEAIKTLLLDKELATRLGNQARHHLEETLTLPGQKKLLIDIYQDLIGEPMDTEERRRNEDTWPQMRQTGSPGTRDDRKVAEDTAPVRLFSDEKTEEFPFLPQDTDTDPGVFADGDGSELIFRAVEQEDTAPRSIPKSHDDWQVMEVSDIQLPKQEPAGGEKNNSKRFLLGGPPFPVEADDSDIFQKPTRRDDRELTPTDLALIADSDVKIIEPEEGEPLDDGPTDPDSKKTKKKAKKPKKP